MLGGSKFMGLQLINSLIENKEKLNLECLLILNRGNEYWNGEFFKIITDKQYIKHIKADRKDKAQFANIIKDIIEKFKYLDYVIDFTCYKRKELEVLLSCLNMNFTKYIFISTDSTYNASPISLERDDKFFMENKNSFIELITEEKAFIVDNEEIKDQLYKRDKYGFNKLLCEEYIQWYFTNNSTSSTYLILRLPDVIGPFDESYRLWYYIEWIKNLHVLPLELNEVDLFRKLSFVYSGDIVKIIINTILNELNLFTQELGKHQYNNQSFNIACQETISLKELLDFLLTQIHFSLSEKEKFECFKIVTNEEYAKTYYPSVNFGAISVQKAMNLLDFEPINIYTAIQNSINFIFKYEKTFLKEYEDMKKDLPKKIKNILIKKD
jgi:nucleoside-diphosphate-sugar epimerase